MLFNVTDLLVELLQEPIHHPQISHNEHIALQSVPVIQMNGLQFSRTCYNTKLELVYQYDSCWDVDNTMKDMLSSRLYEDFTK